ncbi:MAG: HAMP domain-containing histidine kinase [Firmicutes bacterium]|nr:HAMP domain-containing histidine kinase [Bacillota bacterium]
MAVALAHEIKSPAALAMAYVSLIRQSDVSPCIDGYCNYIQQALLDICDLVQELLLAAHNKTSPCVIDITETLSEMVKEYQAAMPGISFSLNAEPSLLCYANEQHVRLIFSNLLKNAAEAVTETNHDRYIAVYAAQKGGCLRVTIHNNGEYVDNLQAKPHGNGIGLCICYWLTEQLGGELKIESGADGGCVVSVSMPCNM